MQPTLTLLVVVFGCFDSRPLKLTLPAPTFKHLTLQLRRALQLPIHQFPAIQLLDRDGSTISTLESTSTRLAVQVGRHSAVPVPCPGERWPPPMAAGAEWIMHQGELWAQLPVGFPNGQSAELQLGPHQAPREVARAFCETHRKVPGRFL